MQKYLISYGLGGCWTGYSHACIVEAPSVDDAYFQGVVITNEAFSANKRKSISIGVEKIESFVENTQQYRTTRGMILKPSAKNMLQNKGVV